MTTFLIEAIVLCVLFHLGVLLQVRKEPVERVYGYPPAIVERYIQLGKMLVAALYSKEIMGIISFSAIKTAKFGLIFLSAFLTMKLDQYRFESCCDH